jgi:hypothetical protein
MVTAKEIDAPYPDTAIAKKAAMLRQGNRSLALRALSIKVALGSNSAFLLDGDHAFSRDLLPAADL